MSDVVLTSSTTVIEIAEDQFAVNIVSEPAIVIAAPDKSTTINIASTPTTVIEVSGQQGFQGPPGGLFVYHQTTPATAWMIQHNLNTFPNVITVGNDQLQIVGDLGYSNADFLTIVFSQAISGTAYLAY